MLRGEAEETGYESAEQNAGPGRGSAHNCHPGSDGAHGSPCSEVESGGAGEEKAQNTVTGWTSEDESQSKGPVEKRSEIMGCRRNGNLKGTSRSCLLSQTRAEHGDGTNISREGISSCSVSGNHKNNASDKGCSSGPEAAASSTNSQSHTVNEDITIAGVNGCEAASLQSCLKRSTCGDSAGSNGDGSPREDTRENAGPTVCSTPDDANRIKSKRSSVCDSINSRDTDSTSESHSVGTHVPPEKDSECLCAAYESTNCDRRRPGCELFERENSAYESCVEKEEMDNTKSTTRETGEVCSGCFVPTSSEPLLGNSEEMCASANGSFRNAAISFPRCINDKYPEDEADRLLGGAEANQRKPCKLHSEDDHGLSQNKSQRPLLEAVQCGVSEDVSVAVESECDRKEDTRAARFAVKSRDVHPSRKLSRNHMDKPRRGSNEKGTDLKCAKNGIGKQKKHHQKQNEVSNFLLHKAQTFKNGIIEQPGTATCIGEHGFQESTSVKVNLLRDTNHKKSIALERSEESFEMAYHEQNIGDSLRSDSPLSASISLLSSETSCPGGADGTESFPGNSTQSHLDLTSSPLDADDSGSDSRSSSASSSTLGSRNEGTETHFADSGFRPHNTADQMTCSSAAINGDPDVEDTQRHSFSSNLENGHLETMTNFTAGSDGRQNSDHTLLNSGHQPWNTQRGGDTGCSAGTGSEMSAITAERRQRKDDRAAEESESSFTEGSSCKEGEQSFGKPSDRTCQRLTASLNC